jgi:hypothetical protein
MSQSINDRYEATGTIIFDQVRIATNTVPIEGLLRNAPLNDWAWL